MALAPPVHMNRLVRLHSIAVLRDQLVCRSQNMRRRAEILQQIIGLGLIIVFEFPDVGDVRTAKRVNVLVVVAHSQNRKLRLGFLAAAIRKGRDQFVLLLIDVLILVDQHVTIARQQSLADFVLLHARDGHFAAEHPGGRRDQFGQLPSVFDVVAVSIGKGNAGQPSGQCVVGQYRHSRTGPADQLPQSAFQLEGGQPVEAQHQNTARRHTQDTDQVRNAMDDDACLAGAGTGQDQHVSIDPCGHNRLLDGMVQLIDDPLVRLMRYGSLDHVLAVAKIGSQEITALIGKIRKHQLQAVSDRLDAATGVFVHHMDLEDLFLVVSRQRLEIALRVASALAFGRQTDSHGLPKDGQPPFQDDRALFVQVHQATINGRQSVLDPAAEVKIGFDGTGQVVAGKFDEYVRRRLGSGRHPVQNGPQDDIRHVSPFF